MRKAKTATVEAVMRDIEKLVRFEPTCIRCGCTWENACDEGCSWTFLNKRTNEGLCSVCFHSLNVKAANGR